MAHAPFTYEILSLPRELEPELCELWSATFGYSERRNDPARVLQDKRRWDGAFEGVLVAVQSSHMASNPSLLVHASHQPVAGPNNNTTERPLVQGGGCAADPHSAGVSRAAPTTESFVLGSIMLGYDGHRGWLYRLAVHPSARGRGVARELVHAAETVLRKQGCTKVNVQVHTDNTAGAAFWRRLGYPLEERLSYGKELLDA